MSDSGLGPPKKAWALLRKQIADDGNGKTANILNSKLACGQNSINSNVEIVAKKCEQHRPASKRTQFTRQASM